MIDIARLKISAYRIRRCRHHLHLRHLSAHDCLAVGLEVAYKTFRLPIDDCRSLRHSRSIPPSRGPQSPPIPESYLVYRLVQCGARRHHGASVI